MTEEKKCVKCTSYEECSFYVIDYEKDIGHDLSYDCKEYKEE